MRSQNQRFVREMVFSYLIYKEINAVSLFLVTAMTRN
jgi:hypothetical protein